MSALGSRAGRAPTSVCADGTRSIVEAMGEAGARRLVFVSNSGMITDGEDGPVTRRLAKPVLQKVLTQPYADMLGMEDEVRASGLDWTIVRPPRLTDGPYTGRYRTAVDRNIRGGFQVSRADLADGILRLLGDPASFRTATSIAS